jgi:rRNA maturation RNase YbeY
MATVNFFCEEIDFSPVHPRKSSSWLSTIARRERAALKEVNFIFCSDEFLAKLNLKYLRHKTLTDIITFDYSESKQKLQGDIYISLDRVKENAVKYNKSFDDELHRVMVHGILHLIGYGDKTAKQKALMRKKEDQSLSLR